MSNAQLKMFVGTTEWGTLLNPISFGAVLSGQVTLWGSNPVYLWNDKGGLLDSVPARDVEIQVTEMQIQDELMGVSDGSPSQSFNALVVPIVDTLSSQEILVKVGTEYWDRVGSFSGTSTDAEIYTIDTVTGLVTFGDSVNGKIPPTSDSIYITYMPKLLLYGEEVAGNNWLEVQSVGATSYSVVVVDEMLTSTLTTVVIVPNTIILSVQGVWLQSDPGHTGTDYYAGGSFDAYTGYLTLGTALPSGTEPVLVSYTYTIIDDAEGDVSPVGYLVSHVFANPIPKNNAKLLYFGLNVPAGATPSGGSQVNFRIRIKYSQ